MYKKWIVPKIDKAQAGFLAEECDIDPFLALILSSRGYSDPYMLEEFLAEECLIGDPYEIDGMYEAVERINIAIDTQEKIAVFGDYDCDGITATVLLVEYFKSRNIDVIYKIPNRDEDGYGMNTRQIDEAKDEGVSLIITVDNGINSVDEIEYANSLDIDIVITDHHLPKGETPNAVAVVDPHRNSNDIFKDLSGVGVAFKLVCAIEHRAPEEMLPYFGDLVAIGTVADIMPLVEDNRSIIRYGLEVLNKRRRVGISALMKVSGSYGKEINTGVISFQIAPRLNSAGRMSDASLSVKLLLEKNYENAVQIAEIINEQNNMRHDIEVDIFNSAVQIIEEKGYFYDRIIVVDGYGWHQGVIGIVASKIVEKYGKPCIVLSTDGVEVTGSGRSIKGFSLFEALGAVSHLTNRFGGHELAAGVGLDEQNIESFRKEINEYAKQITVPFASLKLDCKLNPKALSLDLVRALEPLKPYGVGNPTPLFGIYNVKIDRITSIGQGKHIRIAFSREGVSFNALLFGVSDNNFAYSVGDIVDIAVSMDINEYKERENLSILIKDIHLSGIEQEDLEKGIINYESFKRNEFDFSAKLIFPTREEIGLLFKFLKEKNGRVLKQKAINGLLKYLSLGKIYCAIDILCELGLLDVHLDDDKEILSIVPTNEKTDLEKSLIYKKLKQKAGEI